MTSSRAWRAGTLLVLCFILLWGCGREQTGPGLMLDEARRAGRSVGSFPAADEDYFHDMDGGIALSAEEVKGRNMWLVWTGGYEVGEGLTRNLWMTQLPGSAAP